MSVNFILPQNKKKATFQTLAKGYGLPVVKRAFLNTEQLDSGTNFGIGDNEDGRSWMGTPLFSTLFIERPETSEYIYNEETQQYSETPIVLASNKTIGDKQGVYIEGCIMDVNEVNNVVTTQIDGLNGGVDEFISNGDSIISIRGFFASKDVNVQPRLDTEILRSYCRVGVSLSVVNSYLNDTFGIGQIVVLSTNFFQQQGMRNVQYFEIQAKSSITFTIEEVNA
jgi:hypothetical protein